eukprot:PhM_4_TR17219/c0_g1_i1/m.88815
MWRLPIGHRHLFQMLHLARVTVMILMKANTLPSAGTMPRAILCRIQPDPVTFREKPCTILLQQPLAQQRHAQLIVSKRSRTLPNLFITQLLRGHTSPHLTDNGDVRPRRSQVILTSMNDVGTYDPVSRSTNAFQGSVQELLCVRQNITMTTMSMPTKMKTKKLITILTSSTFLLIGIVEMTALPRTTMIIMAVSNPIYILRETLTHAINTMMTTCRQHRQTEAQGGQ